MQEDVALTEAACPLSKSNYDNHASGKAVARRTGRQALIRQAVYLNHSSPLLQMQSSANVDGVGEKKKLSAGSVSSCVMIHSCFTPRNITCFTCPRSLLKMSEGGSDRLGTGCSSGSAGKGFEGRKHCTVTLIVDKLVIKAALKLHPTCSS